MTRVLAGIRVLDFGRYIAGPWCAALLGDLGAEVIRIEKREGSEDRFIMPVGTGEAGALFLQTGRNKLGMTLDPASDEGRRIVRRLVATADVVVANLPPEGLRSLGLDYETLRAIRHDIILTTITAFGSGGPASGRVGFDGVAQAMSGAMHLSGPPDRPMRTVVNYADFGTAVLSALGTVTALLHRERTGEGQHVEASLLGTALSFLAPNLLEQALNDSDRVGSENRSQHAGPADTFATRDGWVLVQCAGEPLFRRWCRLLGAEEALADPRFATDQRRGDHGEVLSARMAAWCAERTTEQVLGELERARIPAGPVLTPRDVLADAHVRAVGFLHNLTVPGIERPVPVSDTPLRFSTIVGEVRTPAPALGEHTDEILRGLGYDDDAIAELRRKCVI